MKKIITITLLLLTVSAKAQIITENWYEPVEPFKQYYDTVKVWLLVSDSKEYSKTYIITGYDVYTNYYVPQHWLPFDRQVDAHIARERTVTLIGMKTKIPDNIIIWDRKTF